MSIPAMSQMRADSAAASSASERMDRRPVAYSPTFKIDARYAQPGILDQMKSMLVAHDREINRTFGERMDNWRFGTALRS